MKKQIMLIICLILLIGTVLAVDVTKVGDWWGTVTVNGEYANGAVVDAYIDKVKVESAIVGAIQLNYYLIHVEGNEGDNIIFKVNEKEATTQNWSNGDHELDLEVSIDTTVYNDDNGDAPNDGSPSGGSSTTVVTSKDGQIIITEVDNSDEENETIDLNSDESQTSTGPGITGGVIGFVKSGVGMGLIFTVLVLIAGIVVMASRKQKQLKSPKEGEISSEE